MGKDCKFTEPIFNITFDFNDLHSTLAKTVVDELTQNQITFNLCDKSSKLCNGQNVFACLEFHGVNKGKQKILGFDQNLKYTNGRIQFDSVGEECLNGEKYSLTGKKDKS